MMHIAIRAASISTFKQRVGAAIIKNGRVLATACNEIRYKKGNFKKRWENSLHAEQAVILMLSPKQLKGATLYVARILKDGSNGNAKPCEVCTPLILNSGLKAVVYTTELGDILWKL